jgi:hypothetical protein
MRRLDYHRIMRAFRVLVSIAALFGAGRAGACDDLLDFESSVTAATVRASARVYFHQGDGDRSGCPATSAVCRTRAFVVSGDAVLVQSKDGAFACASFVDRWGRQTGGWLLTSALASTPPDPNPQWLGSWTSGPEKRIVITRDKGGIEVSGDATWGASDPERARGGGVNEGEFGASLKPRGPDIAFTLDHNSEVLPYEAGGENDCRLRLSRRGPYLLVYDNVRCGGANVTFSGIYRR